jgi:ABC-2 type transport system permease protein
MKSLKQFQEEFDRELNDAQENVRKATAELEKKAEELQKKSEEGKLEPAEVAEFQELQRKIQVLKAVEEQRLTALKERLQKKLEQAQQRIRREGDQKIESTQNSIKVAASTLPLIFPLVIGLLVYGRRRVREREGVSKSRLRY